MSAPTYGYVSFERILLVIGTSVIRGGAVRCPSAHPDRPSDPASTAAGSGVALNVSCTVATSDRLTIAQVTPHPWGVRGEVNEFVARSRPSSPSAATGSSSSHRRGRGRRSASRARAIAAAEERPASLFARRRAARCSPSAPGSRCRAGRGRARRRCRSTSSRRSSAARRRRARHRPRPRPVRAQPLVGGAAPLALAQRRQLPRAQRAHPLDPGGAAAGRDLLRPPRRPDGLRADDGRADRAVLSRPLRAGRTRRRARVEPWWPGGDAASGKRRLRIAFCLDEERGALRLFLRALRRLDPRWRLGGGGLGRPTRARSASRRALRGRVAVVRPREASAEPLVAAADVLVACSGGPRAAPGVVRTALAAGAVPVVLADRDLQGADPRR